MRGKQCAGNGDGSGVGSREFRGKNLQLQERRVRAQEQGDGKRRRTGREDGIGIPNIGEDGAEPTEPFLFVTHLI